MPRALKVFGFLGVLTLLAALGTVTYGALIGVGGINGTPTTSIGAGTVTFDAGTGDLVLNATPVSTDFGIAGGFYEHAASPASQLQISMRVLDPSANSYQGVGTAFSMSGAIDFNRNGAIETGESGVLLSGSLEQFGYENPAPGAGNDQMDWRFKVTGGLLASYYQGKNIGVSADFANDGSWPVPAFLKRDFLTSFSLNLLPGPTVKVTPIPCASGLGDVVWHDLDGDGIQEPGEPGINGITMRLTDSSGNLITTTVTGPGPLNQQGYYEFGGLCGATYRVEVDLSTVPEGFVPTIVGAPGSTVQTDSNPNPTIASIPNDASKAVSIDFGFYAPADGAIGDFVWHDLNRDGVQDVGEPGIDGVTVNLVSPGTGSVVATTVTAVNGSYLFTGLAAGSYLVEVVGSTLPAGFTATFTTSGPTHLDSDGSPAAVTLPAANSSNRTVDFGYVNPCTGVIGNFVWYDQNANGIQDPGEPGIDGVTVSLLHATTGAVLATTSSGPNGAYAFTGLCGQSYRVVIDPTSLPHGFFPTAIGAVGSTTENDSNANLAVVSLASDVAEDLTIDFGFLTKCNAEIGDFVWHDANRNGVQDASEGGFAGVTVNLRNASDNAIIQTEITSTDGAYGFSGLCPGSYRVEVVPPPGTSASPSLQGGNTETDSNLNPTAVTLNVEELSNLSIDFGFFCSGTIGDFVWHDQNANGLQDSGEPGIAGATVELASEVSGPIATTTTDAVGHYSFTGLCAGTYKVKVTVSSEYLPTTSLAGSNPALDSNDSPTEVTLTANNTVDTTIDFGFVKETPPPPPTTGLKLDKSANKDTVVFGEAVTFTYVVTNTGTVPLQNVVIVDDNATPRYSTDDFTVGTVATLLAGQSVTFTATRVPPAKMCNYDWAGKLRKCGMMLVEHLFSHTKFTYLQSRDHRDDHNDYNGWNGRRSYSHKGKFRVADRWNTLSQDFDSESEELGDNEEYVSAFSVWASKGYVTSNDDSVTIPRIFHKNGWDGDWRHDWDSRWGDFFRSNRWDDDRWGHDNDHDYDWNKHPKPCNTTSTNIATATAKYAGGVLTATDKATVQIVAPAPGAPYKSYTQGGWGAKPSGNNPGRFLANNFNSVYPNGVVIGGHKTIRLTSAYAIEKFLPQGGTPAKLTYNYTNPTSSINVFAGQVLALKLNVDFSAAGITRRGFGNLIIVSGEMEGSTVTEVLALANSVLGGGSLPYGLSISELNGIVTRINENFDGGTNNNGFLTE